MNKKQLVVMWVGISVFIIVGFNTNTTRTFGSHRTNSLVAVTDYGPLIFRLLSVTIVTGALLITFKNRKNS